MAPLTPSPSSPLENPMPSPLPPPPPPQQKPYSRTRMIPPVASPAAYERKLNWAKLIISSCISAAFVVAFQSKARSSQATTSFILLALCISFLCVMIGNSIDPRFPILAKLLDGLAIFSMAQCFLVAITSRLPPKLKYSIWVVSALSLLLVLTFKLPKISTTATNISSA